MLEPTRSGSEQVRSRYVFPYKQVKTAQKLMSVAGVVSAILQTYLDKAKADGVPVWLESTNQHACDVYLHFGFRHAEVFKIGVGKADKDGYRVDGGEGITLHTMIFEA